LTYARGQIGVRRFDEEMIMVGHETKSMAEPVTFLDNVTEY
jgi:hypothetical protein